LWICLEQGLILFQVCWIPVFKGKKLILAGDPMQLPPTILSNDKVDKKKKDKARPGVIQSSSNKNVKAEKKKQNEPSADLAEIATESLVLSDSDSEDSSDGEQVLGEDAAAKVTPSNEPPHTKIADTTKTKTKWTGLRPPQTLETTLFDRLEKMYGTGIKRMLKVQYRLVFTSH